MAAILMERQAGLLVVKKNSGRRTATRHGTECGGDSGPSRFLGLGEFCDLYLQTLERMSSNDWCNLVVVFSQL